jgi:hypothetical protein
MNLKWYSMILARAMHGLRACRLRHDSRDRGEPQNREIQVDTVAMRRDFVRAAVASGIGVLGSSTVASTGPAAETDQWGDLVGRFVYDAPPPERERLKVDKDVACCGKFDIRDETLIVGADRGLANVFLYVRSRGVAICPELEQSVEDKVVLDNRDCIFQPHCLTIWYPEQALEIVNSDPVGQNVAFSPPFDTPVNVVLPVDSKTTHHFHRSQNAPVKIVCNYHPWESGYVLPRDDPYAAVSAADGSFRIQKLPVGKLEFQVWHERVGFVVSPAWPRGRFEITIRPGLNDLGIIKLSPTLFGG